MSTAATKPPTPPGPSTAIIPDRLTDLLLTPRLRLRRWRRPDAAAMAEINSDPEVTRFLGPAVKRGSALDFYLQTTAHWDRHGFGFWAVESRESDRLLGFAGVWYPSFLPEVADHPELGWRLARAAWGRGIATEAAIAARDHAFEVLGLPTLISIIHPDNARSQRVAIKLGMSRWRDVSGLEVWGIGTFPDAWR